MKHVQRWLHSPEPQIAVLAVVAALVMFLLSILLSGCETPGSPTVTSPADPAATSPEAPPAPRPDFEVLAIKGSGTFRFAVFGQPIDIEVGAAGSDTSDACVRVSFRYGIIEAGVDHPKGCTQPKSGAAGAAPSPIPSASSADTTP